MLTMPVNVSFGWGFCFLPRIPVGDEANHALGDRVLYRCCTDNALKSEYSNVEVTCNMEQ
jgi:hypothetical protein